MGRGHIWGDGGRTNINGRDSWDGNKYKWEGGTWGLRHCEGMKPLL